MATTLDYTAFMPHNFERLAAPVNLLESTGEVLVQSITVDVPAGNYLVGLSFVCNFTSANDQLTWRFAGDYTSGNFLKEAKDANEAIPFGYSLPAIHAGGPVTVELYASISGIGDATAQIPFANIWISRMG